MILARRLETRGKRLAWLCPKVKSYLPAPQRSPNSTIYPSVSVAALDFATVVVSDSQKNLANPKTDKKVKHGGVLMGCMNLNK